MLEKGQAHSYEVRERFNQMGNPLDLLFLNRSSFNGILRFNQQGKFNVPFGHKPARFRFDLLTATHARFIPSTWHSNRYRQNPALEKYARRFRVFTREHFYHVGASEKNRHPMLEAIVLNYDPNLPPQRPALNQMALFTPAAK